MNIGQQILFLVSALGAFNGIILSFYLFFGKKRRSLSAILLATLLLALSIRVGKSVFLYFNPQLPNIYKQIGLSACFFIGPAMYYFFRAAIEKVSQPPASWKWVWGVQAGILVLTGILFPYETHPWLWNRVIAWLIYLQWMVYVIATGILLRNLLKTFLTKPKDLNDQEKFWLVLYGGNCFVFIAYLLAIFEVMNGIYISGPVAFSFTLYLTLFFYQYGAGYENAASSGRSEKRKIADNDARLWIEKLEKVIRDHELYKDPNLKLNDLAQRINVSPHQLSQLLNDNLGKSFSTYINEYGISEACRLIEKSRHLTCEAIGYEVGYNSKSTFYAAFRKIKDTTPALYKEKQDAIIR